MPKPVGPIELPCQFQGIDKASGIPPCSGPVEYRLLGYYGNHPQAYRPQWADVIDEALVCDAHADWHSGRCSKCGLARTAV